MWFCISNWEKLLGSFSLSAPLTGELSHWAPSSEKWEVGNMGIINSNICLLDLLSVLGDRVFIETRWICSDALLIVCDTFRVMDIYPPDTQRQLHALLGKTTAASQSGELQRNKEQKLQMPIIVRVVLLWITRRRSSNFPPHQCRESFALDLWHFCWEVLKWSMLHWQDTPNLPFLCLKERLREHLFSMFSV